MYLSLCVHLVLLSGYIGKMFWKRIIDATVNHTVLKLR